MNISETIPHNIKHHYSDNNSSLILYAPDAWICIHCCLPNARSCHVSPFATGVSSSVNNAVIKNISIYQGSESELKNSCFYKMWLDWIQVFHFLFLRSVKRCQFLRKNCVLGCHIFLPVSSSVLSQIPSFLFWSFYKKNEAWETNSTEIYFTRECKI